jgi:hypothetical protein
MTASARRPIPTEAMPAIAGAQAVDVEKSELIARRRREAGLRASAEAAARRAQADELAAAAPPVERGGRDGPDPVRYGDWEVKGIATDF